MVGDGLSEVVWRKSCLPVATTICVESWFLYSMVEDWLGYLLGLVAVFDLVFLYGLVFCLGVSLMMGLGLRRVVFLGVGL